ncbi:MAG: hypothetical protein ACXWZS_15960, partial [Gemmatirosa sp.]
MHRDARTSSCTPGSASSSGAEALVALVAQALAASSGAKDRQETAARHALNIPRAAGSVTVDAGRHGARPTR